MDISNLILICGRLGRDPELKYTKKLEPVCTFSIAEQIKGTEKPNWHKVVVWGKSAESCKVQLQRGSLIFVRGRKSPQEFTNKEGEKKKYIEIHADTIGITYS